MAMETRMEHDVTDPELFDRVVEELGYKNGKELSAACGRNNRSASNWRQHGFPAARLADLLRLSDERARPLSVETMRLLLARFGGQGRTSKAA